MTIRRAKVVQTTSNRDDDTDHFDRDLFGEAVHSERVPRRSGSSKQRPSHTTPVEWEAGLFGDVSTLNIDTSGMSLLTTYEEFDRVDAERCRLGLTEEPHTPEWIASAALFLGGHGGLSDHELRAITTGSPAFLATTLDRCLAALGRVRRKAVRNLPIPADPRKALRDELGGRDVTFTWCGGDGKAPGLSDDTVSRLLALPPEARPQAILHQLISARNTGGGRAVVRQLAHERGVEIYEGIDRFDPVAVRMRHEAYLRGEILPGDTLHTRTTTIQNLEACSNILRDFVGEPIPDELARYVASVTPALPDEGDGRYLAALRGSLKQHSAATAARNETRIAKVKDNFDPLLALSTARMAVSRRAYAAGEAASANLAATGAASIAYSYVEPVLLPDGTYGAGTQTVFWIAWNEQALIDQALVALSRSDERLTGVGPAWSARCSGGNAMDPGAAGRIHLEFVGVDGNDGAKACEPFFAEPLRAGVALYPGHMSAGLRERRRECIIANELPIPRCRPPGLIGPAPDWESTMTRVLLDGLGTILVQMPRLHRGLLFAAALHRTQSMTAARGGEGLQMIDDQAGWGWEDVGGEKRPTFSAVPKSSAASAAPRSFKVDDRSVELVAEIIRTTLNVEGLGDRLPIVPCAQQLGWKLGPDRYIFQAAGRALRTCDVSYCASWLFFGFGRAQTHDFRRGAANRGAVEGASDKEVASRLGHNGVSLVPTYARRTRRQTVDGIDRYINERITRETLGASGAINMGSPRP